MNDTVRMWKFEVNAQLLNLTCIVSFHPVMITWMMEDIVYNSNNLTNNWELQLKTWYLRENPTESHKYYAWREFLPMLTQFIT